MFFDAINQAPYACRSRDPDLRILFELKHFSSHFRVISAWLHAREVLFLSYQVGWFWFIHTVRPSASRTYLWFIHTFIPVNMPFNEFVTSHAHPNRNYMLFVVQCYTFLQKCILIKGALCPREFHWLFFFFWSFQPHCENNWYAVTTKISNSKQRIRKFIFSSTFPPSCLCTDLAWKSNSILPPCVQSVNPKSMNVESICAHLNKTNSKLNCCSDIYTAVARTVRVTCGTIHFAWHRIWWRSKTQFTLKTSSAASCWLRGFTLAMMVWA